MDGRRSRRGALRLIARVGQGLAGTALLAACGGAVGGSTNVTANVTSATSAASSAVSSSLPPSRPATAASSTTTTAGTTPSAIVATATTAATATAAAPGKAQVVMEFENFFDPDPNLREHFKQLATMWEAQHRGVRWQGVAATSPQMQQKLITLVAGGSPPDGTSASEEWGKVAAIQGLIQPLDDRIAKEAKPVTDWFADLLPARWSNYAVNNKRYCLPIDLGTEAIFYNKDLLAVAGLPEPKADWTWDDLWAMATKLTTLKGQQQQYGFNYPTDLHWMYSAYGSLGGSYFDERLTKATFDTPASQTALQTLLDAKVKSHVTPYGAALTTLTKTANGKFPFTLGWYGMELFRFGLIGYLHAANVGVQNWDVAPIPKGTQRQQIVGGQGFALVTGAKHPDEAWSWSKFMVSDDAQKYIGQNSVWNPGRRSMGHYALPPDGKPSRFLEAFYDTVTSDGFSPWWYVPGWDQWSKVINDGLAPAWNGQASASDVAAKITPALDTMLKSQAKS
jgi:multiple sugar transport system substrate-binding protein